MRAGAKTGCARAKPQTSRMKPAIDSSEKNAFVAVLAEPADQPVAQARERRQNVDAEKDDDADRVMSALRWLADVDAADWDVR